MINRIAPVLRMLTGNNNRYPLVSFSQNEITNAVVVDLSAEMTDAQIIAACAAVIKSSAMALKAVNVPGVGSFEILPCSPDLSGRVAGKIAIVTGAAQGFGLEIAQDLAAQGAFVALADINESAATEAAAGICAQHGPDRAIALAMNVTSLASIQMALDKVVSVYGGLDIFVSNAGVLKAESVKTQSEKDFDFVTAVNYKGYFLCTQVIAPIMALQHQAQPQYTSDIIQINSKSGLVGSNKNAAYAGSKFGGIGLTESFALELITDGIKVNSICPGNFFDGPLWSNPDNGLFVQYLRTGKIPGAKTIEEVKKAYEAKVPMGRGCTTADVMKAIYYLVDQQYETGQALPVTGGQEMLH
ncbi:MAG: SDR family NAD(P)-dependent oxidoreductase [Sedimentisphaerales bacterium]|nr:SDR family NAD(P)-dependent oxidoreductase [Sedimentisphaerales bacterium]